MIYNSAPVIFLTIFLFSSISGQKTGPCTVGTYSRSAALKCTDNGYFELVQCLSDHCVCVDPQTGHEATSTRTQSNRIMPKCGACHTQIARRLASNTSTSNLPQCDPKTGDFMPKQCQGDDICWCVNRETGEKRGKFSSPNRLLTCSLSERDDQQNSSQQTPPPIDFSIDSSGSFHSVAGTKDREEAPVANAFCKLPKARGNRCSEKSPTIQWYFDIDSFECLAFRFEGCGGNENRYDSITECWGRCKLADFGGCAGLRSPAKNSKGENIICMKPNGPSNGPSAECPRGHKCTMTAFFGICCHEETQELYNRNYRPQCSGGRALERINAGGIDMTLLGKSCSDEFCPASTECRKLEVFAHCCKR